MTGRFENIPAGRRHHATDYGSVAAIKALMGAVLRHGEVILRRRDLLRPKSGAGGQAESTVIDISFLHKYKGVKLTRSFVGLEELEFEKAIFDIKKASDA